MWASIAKWLVKGALWSVQHYDQLQPIIKDVADAAQKAKESKRA
jgi:hypothetical protein